MLKIATKTKLSPEEVIKRAVGFFGPDGYGLEVKNEDPGCASFGGSGGGISVTTCIEDKETSGELESREWDYQAKEFITKIR